MQRTTAESISAFPLSFPTVIASPDAIGTKQPRWGEGIAAPRQVGAGNDRTGEVGAGIDM